MLKLSIIVPMYNVAPYVTRCIRSLEEQDIPQEDYEIICVNDGSPDNCQQVVEDLQQEFSNILLINQENKGVSIARNNGIDQAKGKYLLFIDPDDYVDTNTFQRIIQTADINQAQVTFLGFTFLKQDGSIRKEVLNEKESDQTYKGIDAYFLARGDGQTDPDRMVAVLFERNFINEHQLRYLEGVPYLEDGELIARIMCHAVRCNFGGHSFYQRTTRPGSATNSNLMHSQKAINGFIKSACNLKEFQQNERLTTEVIDFLNQPIAKFSILAVTPSVNNSDFQQLKKTRIILKEKKLIKLNTVKLKGEFLYLALALNSSIFLFYVYWQIRRFSISLKSRL